MFASFFYHGTVRKTVLSFASLFSNIRIQRKNEEGQIEQDIRVPISYAEKEKFVFRRQGDPNLNAVVGIELPRLSFSVSSYTYDSSRKINTTQSIVSKTDGAIRQGAPVPYNVGLKLHIYTKTQEDALIIMEQVFPLFTPEYNVTINTVPETGIRQDVPIVLNSVNVETVYTEDREAVRMIIHSLDFVAKVNFFGPAQPFAPIKVVDVDLDQYGSYQAAVFPFDANKNDDYVIEETYRD